MPERPYKPVAHTCPAIDEVNRIIRRHVTGQDAIKALQLMEELREQNTQLRANEIHALRSIAQSGQSR